MIGQLFTQYFLTEGITVTDAWQDCVRQPLTFGTAFKQSLRDILDPRQLPPPTNPTRHKLKTRSCVRFLNCWVGTTICPSKAQTAKRTFPITCSLPMGGEETGPQRARAPKMRFQDALVIEESKRFGLPLDNRDSGETSPPRHPSRPDSQVSRHGR